MMHVYGPPHIVGYYAQTRFIRDGIAKLNGFTTEELVSPRRSKRLVQARHLAIYLVSKATPWSLPQIGKFFGDKDHTSILHAIRKVEAEINGREFNRRCLSSDYCGGY